MEKIFKSKVAPVVNKPLMKVLCAIPGLNQVIFKKIRTQLLNAFGGNVREIVMGGAALNPDVEKWFRKFKLPFTVGYGMTEAAPLLAYEDWWDFASKSCGKPVDSVEVRIDSDDPINKVGEIQAKGISLMSGYYKNDEATKAAFTEDGWMRTGDLGVMDASGNIFIRGRSKNMILSANGQNIYPEEIEAVVNNQPYVIESVVVDRGASLVALVYADSDKLAAEGTDCSLSFKAGLRVRMSDSYTATADALAVQVWRAATSTYETIKTFKTSEILPFDLAKDTPTEVLYDYGRNTLKCEMKLYPGDNVELVTMISGFIIVDDILIVKK
jgi:long-chain acyl-CoA synthetase